MEFLTIRSATYNVYGMTIDERIAKLAERHEALTQSVEILTNDLQRVRNQGAWTYRSI